MILGTTPFVLLDDAQGAAPARLYRDPVDLVATREPGEVRACLDRLRGSSLHAAGFLSYEAGHALEPKLAPLCKVAARQESPLLWFGLFEQCEEVEAASLLPDPASAWARAPRPSIRAAAYQAQVAEVKAHIEAGNVYQANLTFGADVVTAGTPLALYAALRERSRAGHGAIVFTGEHWLLSFSPELFFTLEGNRLTTRPMKGTARRGATPADDVAAARALLGDPKQRAENLMIVDLLRNDLSRVSKAGSVAVPSLFAIETYPTVHQMTSTVVAQLEDGLGPIDVIAAMFPCGSITGAPKIRAMEIIAGLEPSPRGPYTGSIGAIAPDGSARFNVAIRTLTMRAGESLARLGLGSGVVADSVAADEWAECLAKGAFVSDPDRSFDLFETMRFDPVHGIAHLEAHLARMKASAETLGFPFDRHGARNELQAATFRLRAACKLRLFLSPSGAIAVESRALAPQPDGPVIVKVVPLPVAPEDFRLCHKTSDRGFYAEALEEAGTFEVLFEDRDGFLTEGSFTSLFVERGGTLLTPPLSRGLLPGILRKCLIEEGKALETDLRVTDLREGFTIGNAVRGLIPARLAGE